MSAPQEKDQNQSKYRVPLGLLGCFGGFCVQLVIGSLYQWGMINIYISSYYHMLDSSVTLESSAIAFPLMMFCIGLTMRLGLFLSEKTHPLIILTINQILSALVVFISSYMETLWLFLLFFGILFGLIAGLSFMVPIIECNKYFPGKKMYVNGFILIATGLGPVIFGLFSYNFLNPNKLAPLNGYYMGTPQLVNITNTVPTLLKWLSLIYLGIGLLGVLCMGPLCIDNRRRQNQLKEKVMAKIDRTLQNLRQHEPQQQPPKKPHPHEHHSLKQIINQAKSIGQAICSRIFWILVLILILAPCGAFLINGNYKTYVKTTIVDDQFLTITGVVASIFNGFSRPIWNLIFSKTGYKSVMLAIITLSIIVFATIRFTLDNKAAYLVEVTLANICLGGFMVTTPTALQALYGLNTGSNIYGVYWDVIATTNFIQYIYVQFLSKQIGFNNVIYICLGMCVLAIPLVIFTTFQGPWKNEVLSLEYHIGNEMKKLKKLQQQMKPKQGQHLQRVNDDVEHMFIQLKTSKQNPNISKDHNPQLVHQQT